MITVVIVLPLAFTYVTSAIVLVRRGREPTAVLLAVGLVALYFFTSGGFLGVESEWVRNASCSVAVVIIAWFTVGFPTASIVPRWGWATPGVVAVAALVDPSIAARSRQILTDPALDGALWISFTWSVALAGAVAAQIVRYRSHSGIEERYQTRWVLAGLAGTLLPPGVLLLLTAVGTSASSAAGWLVLASALGGFGLPVAVLVSVFRYHLYDLDRLVSRTVTYALVGVVVSAAYGLAVVALSAVVRSDEGIVVAFATLAAAAAFAPAHSRIQRIVERRFNRQRFDAEAEIGALSARAAEAADADVLERDMVDIVGRTLQPASISFWRNAPENLSRPAGGVDRVAGPHTDATAR